MKRYYTIAIFSLLVLTGAQCSILTPRSAAPATGTSKPAPAQISPTQDSDGDGLPDVQEIKLGTNPYSADTDGDGLGDKYEVDNGLDPLVPNKPPVRAKNNL